MDPMRLVIRKARLADAPALSRLLASTWRKAFHSLLKASTIREVSRKWHSSAHLAGQIRDKDVYFGVAARGKRILALTTVRRTGGKSAFMLRLYVRPGCQGAGLGEKLLEAGLEAFPRLRRLRLEVLAGNDRAIEFYRRHGFRRVGRKREPVAAECLDLAVMEKRRARAR